MAQDRLLRLAQSLGELDLLRPRPTLRGRYFLLQLITLAGMRLVCIVVACALIASALPAATMLAVAAVVDQVAQSRPAYSLIVPLAFVAAFIASENCMQTVLPAVRSCVRDLVDVEFLRLARSDTVHAGSADGLDADHSHEACEAVETSGRIFTMGVKIPALADGDLFLERGCVQERGTHEDLMAAAGRYAKWFMDQQ